MKFKNSSLIEWCLASLIFLVILILGFSSVFKKTIQIKTLEYQL